VRSSSSASARNGRGPAGSASNSAREPDLADPRRALDEHDFPGAGRPSGQPSTHRVQLRPSPTRRPSRFCASRIAHHCVRSRDGGHRDVDGRGMGEPLHGCHGQSCVRSGDDTLDVASAARSSPTGPVPYHREMASPAGWPPLVARG
jgi:hypothetical protein